jgi:hypothetical protein
MSAAAAPVLNDDSDVDDTTPRRSRLRLDTVDRVRRELVRLYRDGRDGRRDTQDVSRLANVLMIVVRCLEGADLEKRLGTLEAAAKERR